MRYMKQRQNGVQGFPPTRVTSITTINRDEVVAWSPTVDTSYKIDGVGTSAPLLAGSIRVLHPSITSHVLDTPVVCEIWDEES